MSYLLDILFILAVGGGTWWLARFGAVRAGVCLVVVAVSSVFAMTTFEVVGRTIAQLYLSSSEDFLKPYTLILALLLIAGVSLAALLYVSRKVLPQPPTLPDRWESPVKWMSSFATAYLLAAFLLTACHTFPGPRDFWDVFPPQADRRAGPVMAMAPDYQFLGFLEFSVGRAFATDSDGWTLSAPYVSMRARGSHWRSFPSRYALWREAIESRWFAEEETPPPID